MRCAINKNKLSLICIFFIFIVSLFVTINNFRTGYSLIGGDAGAVQEYPISAFKEALYTWFDKDNTGSNFGVNPSSAFPYLALLAFLKLIGFPAIFGQKVYFLLMFFISGTSAYYLIRYIIGVNEYRVPFIGLIGAFFYMFNHYTMVTWSSALSNYSIPYLITPALVLLYLKGLETKKNYYVVLISITSIIAFGGNLAMIAILIFGLFLISIINILETRNLLEPLWFAFKVCILSIIMNLWWLVPTILSAKGLVENVQIRGNLNWLNWMNSRTSLLNLFRLDGYTGWIDFFPYGSNFNNKFILVLVGYLFVMLIFSSIFYIKKNRFVKYFLVITLTSIFMAKGVHTPFAKIFTIMFNYIPGFSIFRSSYDKFIPLAALGYSCMISIAVDKLSMIVRKWSTFIANSFVCVIIVFIILYPYPFIKGSIIRTEQRGKRDFFVKVPNEYKYAGEWINKKNDDYRLFIVPQKQGDYYQYSWGYFGPSIERYLYNKPTIDSTLKKIKYHLNLTKNIVPFLNLFTIKYLIFHFDSVDIKTTYNLEEIIRNSKKIKLLKDLGSFKIYSIKKEHLLKKIYIPNNIIAFKGETEDIPILTDFGLLNDKPMLFCDDNVLNIKDNIKKIVFCNKYNSLLVRNYSNQQLNNIIWDKRGKLVEKGFYIPKNSKYNLIVNLSAADEDDGKKLKKVFKECLLDKNILHEWRIDKHNTKYTMDINDENIIFKLLFQGNSNDDEYIQLKRENLNIDLEMTPYLLVRGKVEDPKVQLLQIVIGVDFDGDGKTDEYLRNIGNIWPKTVMQEEIYNLLREVKILYPNKKRYIITELEIYPHKKWGVDCSGAKRGEYLFYVENIHMFKGEPRQKLFKKRNIIESFKSKFISKKGIINNNESYIEYKISINDINVNKIPLINYCSIGRWHKIEKIKVLVKLDVDGNDEELEYLYYPIYNNGYENITINMQDILDNKYKRKNIVPKLKEVKWHIYGPEEYIKENLFLYKIEYLNIFSEKRINIINKKTIIPIVRIDNKLYKINKQFNNIKDMSNFKIRFNDIKISKGWHRIYNEIVHSGNYQLNSVLVQESNGYKIKKTSEGDLEYKKINPTRYNVIANKNGSFWLVFSETFNTSWKAYMYKDAKYNTTQSWSALWQMWMDRGNRIELKNHYMVNGYANGWYINKVKSQNEKGKTKGIEIIIEYVPQRFFELGVLISSIGVLGGVGFLWLKRLQGR